MSHARSTERAAIYREAAKLLESGAKSIWPAAGSVAFACEAIDTALGLWAGGGKCPECDAMRDVYAPDDYPPWGAWLSGISSENADVEEDREGRILALCFMAAMVEAGDA